MQITSYLEQAVTSELSGNVVDLCPVGALTSSPMRSRRGRGSCKKTLTHRRDGRGRHQHPPRQPRAAGAARAAADQRGRERGVGAATRRATPSMAWCGGGSTGRIVRKGGKLVEATLGRGVRCDRGGERGQQRRGDPRRSGRLRDDVCGQGADATRWARRCSRGGRPAMDYDVSSLAAVNFNTTIAGIENADAILLVGTNLRWEAPLVNTRDPQGGEARREGVRDRAGDRADLSRSNGWATTWRCSASCPRRWPRRSGKAERPAIIVGGWRAEGRAWCRAEAASKKLGAALEDGWNGFNVLHMAASRMGGLMLGCCAAGRDRRHRRGRAEAGVLPGRGRGGFRQVRRQLQGLHRSSRRQGRAGGRRGAAGRQLCREAGHLRQPRRPRAARPSGRCSRRATRARTGRSCARCRERLGATLPFDSYRRPARGDVRRLCRRSRHEGLAAYDWAPPDAGREGDGDDRRLSDQGFLPDQRDLPRVARRCSVARPNWSTARISRRRRSDRVLPEHRRHVLRMGVVRRDDRRHPGDRAAADAGGGDDHLCRPQDLGGDGAAGAGPTWSGRSGCCSRSRTG